MNAIDLLKADHRTVEDLFKKFERANRGDQKRKIADEIVKELSIHAAVEEQLLYPAIRERVKPLEDDTLEALEEHHVVKWLVHEVDTLAPDNERFDAKMTVLKEVVEHHVEEEEKGLFPRMKRGFKKEELEMLGAMLVEAKRVAPTRPHPKQPDEPPGNFVAGGLAAVLDCGRELLMAAGERGAQMISGSRKSAPRKSTKGGAKKATRGAGGKAKAAKRKTTARKTASRTARKTASRKPAAKPSRRKASAKSRR